jgi:hypothetical protein
MLNDFKTFCLKDDTSKMEKTVLCIRIYTVDGQVNSRQETSVSADALQSYVSKYLEYVKNNSITKLDLGFCAATLDGKRMHIVSNIPDPNDPSVHLSKYPLPIQQQSDYEQLMPKGCLPWREFQNQITL